LGNLALGMIYVALIISSLTIPSLVLSKLGVKWTIIASMTLYLPYLLAQFKPTFYTLLPASVFIGGAAAPLWIAKCAYLTKVNILS